MPRQKKPTEKLAPIPAELLEQHAPQPAIGEATGVRNQYALTKLVRQASSLGRLGAERGLHEAEQADRRGFRQRLDEHPALPVTDIEAVHEGRVALPQFANADRGGKQRRVDAGVEVQKEVPDALLPVVWQNLWHRASTNRVMAPRRRPSRLAAGLRQTQGGCGALTESVSL